MPANQPVSWRPGYLNHMFALRRTGRLSVVEAGVEAGLGAQIQVGRTSPGTLISKGSLNLRPDSPVLMMSSMFNVRSV